MKARLMLHFAIGVANLSAKESSFFLSAKIANIALKNNEMHRSVRHHS